MKSKAIIISINIVVCLIISIACFNIGRTSVQGSQDASSETIVENIIDISIEGKYVLRDVDFVADAKYIKDNFKTPMSTSKIKHLLIYIEGLCKYYDLNYNLVKSVISTESHWRYNAKSNAGAVGLMQIMKACAKDYKTPHSEMYDPYVNVTIGIKYLSKLIDRFDNTQTALVGYNEGPRYAEKYKMEYINNSRYVTKVSNYLNTFEPEIIEVASIDY